MLFARGKKKRSISEFVSHIQLKAIKEYERAFINIMDRMVMTKYGNNKVHNVEKRKLK
jgi:hypothetical protein